MRESNLTRFVISQAACTRIHIYACIAAVRLHNELLSLILDETTVQRRGNRG